ncbi:hypothetical protein EDB83DRAFT_1844426 [Lactarius deliciosus]|nr:hypothetical protein EDB83DRAFT_1844426 [Lactarius deliciosus]
MKKFALHKIWVARLTGRHEWIIAGCMYRFDGIARFCFVVRVGRLPEGVVSIGLNPAGAKQVRKFPGHHSLALRHPQFVQERANARPVARINHQQPRHGVLHRHKTHELRGAHLHLPFPHLSKARSASAVGARPKREEHDAERLNDGLSVVVRAGGARGVAPYAGRMHKYV